MVGVAGEGELVPLPQGVRRQAGDARGLGGSEDLDRFWVLGQTVHYKFTTFVWDGIVVAYLYGILEEGVQGGASHFHLGKIYCDPDPAKKIVICGNANKKTMAMEK